MAPELRTRTGAELRRRRRILVALSVTQTIGYGTLFYSFAVYLQPLARDLQISTAVVAGSYTANVLAGAVVAVPFGWWLDRHGGRALMTLGSAGAFLLLLAWSRVDSAVELYAVQIGIGIVGAATLYEAALPVVVTWYEGPARPRALLTVTVAAGFASTIFLPLTSWLVERHGWRTSLVILALLYLITVPLHALVRRAPRRTAGTDRPARSGKLHAVVRDRVFWLLAAGFMLQTAAITAFTVHLVSALTYWHYAMTVAATIAGLLGVLSVLGRLLLTGLQTRLSTARITATVFFVQAASAFLLPVVSAAILPTIGAVIGFGIGMGIGTVAKPILLAERYGVERYATLAGLIAVPMTGAKAFSPLTADVLRASAGGYPAVFVAIGLCCLVAGVAFLLVGVPSTRDR